MKLESEKTQKLPITSLDNSMIEYVNYWVKKNGPITLVLENIDGISIDDIKKLSSNGLIDIMIKYDEETITYKVDELVGYMEIIEKELKPSDDLTPINVVLPEPTYHRDDGTSFVLVKVEQVSFNGTLQYKYMQKECDGEQNEFNTLFSEQDIDALDFDEQTYFINSVLAKKRIEEYQSKTGGYMGFVGRTNDGDLIKATDPTMPNIRRENKKVEVEDPSLILVQSEIVYDDKIVVQDVTVPITAFSSQIISNPELKEIQSMSREDLNESNCMTIATSNVQTIAGVFNQQQISASKAA